MTSGTKRKMVEIDEREKEKRKKKNEKWQEVKAAKAAETNEKKTAWQNFGKKATKKGVKIGGWVIVENVPSMCVGTDRR